MKIHVFALCLCAAAPSLTAAEVPKPETPDAPLSAKSFSGKILETTNAAAYTYVLVDSGNARHWAAAPRFDVKPGDEVTVTDGMPMPKYHSKTLNRTFDVVYFTPTIKRAGDTNAAADAVELPKGHPPIGGATPQPAMDFSGIKPAKEGKTVAEINTGRKKLNGKPVTVRGKVVKYNAEVMGKNWLHIRDGSGSEGSNDLTVTTSSSVKVGDTVLVTGKVVTDRDFGAGYKYSVIIEDAKVVVE